LLKDSADPALDKEIINTIGDARCMTPDEKAIATPRVQSQISYRIPRPISLQRNAPPISKPRTVAPAEHARLGGLFRLAARHYPTSQNKHAHRITNMTIAKA